MSQPAELYHEALRPQVHFTARQWTIDKLNPGQREEGWINDLNGLIYYEGEYHMFAQRWNQCWLHAVSKDLVHWTELKPAFVEEGPGIGCQSGTCVIDYKNTSGLATDPKHPAMVAFWSRADNLGQCISFSLDKGRTWQHYRGNPLMEYRERDPKVFWHEPSKHWVMFLYGDEQYHVLTSLDLLHWKDEHRPVPHSFECPDFFELPLDGNHNNRRWVLMQGSGQYSVGSFDGTEFTPETSRFPCDIGPNFYATQSWANTDTGDGRRIQAAWMRGSDFPGMRFNQMISFPCELTLHSTPGGPRVFRQPVKEIKVLHAAESHWRDQRLDGGQPLTLSEHGDLFHVVADVELGPGAKLELSALGTTCAVHDSTLVNGDASASASGPIHHLEFIIDRTSIEAYANHGELSSTRFVLPKSEGLRLSASGGSVLLKSLTVYPLRSCWTHK